MPILSRQPSCSADGHLKIQACDWEGWQASRSLLSANLTHSCHMSNVVNSRSTSSPYDPPLLLPFVTNWLDTGSARVLEFGLNLRFCGGIARDIADVVDFIPGLNSNKKKRDREKPLEKPGSKAEDAGKPIDRISAMTRSFALDFYQRP